ncbi:MAG: hypothetical protein KGH98_04205 [Candidatus Micrarchaeota archaeon]|nr:hypothetical protein [Candidatus Micrarchaeota archaeon]
MMVAQQKALPYKPEEIHRQITRIAQENLWIRQKGIEKVADNIGRNYPMVMAYLNNHKDANLLWVIRAIELFIDLMRFVGGSRDIIDRAAHDIAIKAINGQGIRKDSPESKDYIISLEEREFFCLKYAVKKINQHVKEQSIKEAIPANVLSFASIIHENQRIKSEVQEAVAKNIANNFDTCTEYFTNKADSDLGVKVNLALPLFSIDDFLYNPTNITSRLKRELAIKAVNCCMGNGDRFTEQEAAMFDSLARSAIFKATSKYKNGSSQTV